MIPTEELDQLALVLSEAAGAFRDGRITRGYMVLRNAFCDADASPQPYSAELAEIYRRTLDGCKEQFPDAWYPPER